MKAVHRLLRPLAAAVITVAVGVAINQVRNGGHMSWWWLIASVALAISLGVLNQWLSRVDTASAGQVTTERVAKAADELAYTVLEQWEKEAKARSLDDPAPMPVRWQRTSRIRLIDRSVNLTPGAFAEVEGFSVGEPASLVSEFRRMRRRRLVILGGPGSGKTTLAVQLVRELLRTRSAEGNQREPVPVLLSVAGWNTDAYHDLSDWVTARLAHDYPSLRDLALGPAMPEVLTRSHMILPVLDGLDELPTSAQTAVISALRRLSDDDQVILTSRTDEFERAVAEAGAVVTSAMVIEPEPLTADESADYLEARLPPEPGPIWEQIIASMRSEHTPDSASLTSVTELVTSPLNLWLLGTVYTAPHADPAPLLSRFANAAALRAHLFDRLIPELIMARPPSKGRADLFRPRRQYDPAQVRSWLGYLANYLSRTPARGEQTGTCDFAWWQLARGTLSPRTLPRLIGFTAWLAFGLVCALVGELAHGLVAGILAGVIGGGLAGLAANGVAEAWLQQTPGFADIRLRRRIARTTKALTVSMLNFGVWSAIWVGGLFGFGIWRGFWLGLGVGLAAGLVESVETPARSGRASNPVSTLRADRLLNVFRGLLAGMLLVLFFGYALKLGLIGGLAYGLIGGLVFGLMLGNHHAWPAYLLATYRLAWDHHRLPRRLIAFLDDAHRLGLLRAVGPIYQFRHANFQDYLAATYRPPSAASQSASALDAIHDRLRGPRVRLARDLTASLAIVAVISAGGWVLHAGIVRPAGTFPASPPCSARGSLTHQHPTVAALLHKSAATVLPGLGIFGTRALAFQPGREDPG